MTYFEQFEEMANLNYDGHYTIMKFTGNYRIAFGTLMTDDLYELREEISKMPHGKTLEEACKMCIAMNHEL